MIGEVEITVPEETELIQEVYTDGGCAGAPRSQIGGAIAFKYVGPCVRGLRSQFIHPEDVRSEDVTNNNVELLAAICALEFYLDLMLTQPRLPRTIRLYTDSASALHWIKGDWKISSQPQYLIKRRDLVKQRCIDNGLYVKLTLIAGHPTPTERAQGWKMKGTTQYQVSVHNEDCDKQCTRLCKEKMQELCKVT